MSAEFLLRSAARISSSVAATAKALAPAADLVRRAAAADRFTGKSGATLDIVAPAGLSVPRLVVIGTGKDAELKPQDFVKLGGIAMGKVPSAAAEATIVAEFAVGCAQARAGRRSGARRAAAGLCVRPLQDQAQGRRGARRARSESIIALCQSGRRREGVGAHAARSPTASCSRAISSTSRPTCSIRRSSPAARRQLKKLGVAVEVLDVPAMKKLGMDALLGVGQGSRHESRARHHALERRQDAAPSRSPSSARACASIPAASRSSRPPAWRT